MKQIHSLILAAALLCCTTTAFAGELKIGINDSSQKNAPVYASDADRYQYHNQTIYLASELTALVGQQITKITYYQKSLARGDYANVQISLMEVSNEAFSYEDNFLSTASAQVVYTGSLSNSLTIEITFTDPYVYNGGNLLVDVQKTQPSGGNYAQSFKGFEATNGSYYRVLYGGGSTSGLPSSGTGSTARPDVTFTYEEAKTSSCAAVKAPVASEITATSAKLTWEKADEVENYQFECVLKGGTPAWEAAAENVLTVTLDTLKANTEYDFYVRTYCGAGEGEQGVEKKVSFSTDKSCYEPTNLQVPEANITSTSAKVTWSGSGKGETEYQYTYGAYGSTPDWSKAVKTSEKEVTLSDLEQQSYYQVWVRSYCGPEDQSEEITEYFATHVDCSSAKKLPLNEDFSAEENIACWTLENCVGNTGVDEYSAVFAFYYTTSPSQYLITPELIPSTNKVKVEFMYKAYSSYYEESFIVGYSTTTKDVNSAFTWGNEVKTNATSYGDPYSEVLPAGVKFVAIQCTSNNKFYLYIDDFSVVEIEPTAIDNTAVKAKSTKRIENGTLIIENNGVLYNAQGARVSK